MKDPLTPSQYFKQRTLYYLQMWSKGIPITMTTQSEITIDDVIKAMDAAEKDVVRVYGQEPTVAIEDQRVHFPGRLGSLCPVCKEIDGYHKKDCPLINEITEEEALEKPKNQPISTLHEEMIENSGKGCMLLIVWIVLFWLAGLTASLWLYLNWETL